MKRKIFAFILPIVLTGCLEKSHLNDNLYGSSVYFIDSGLQKTGTIVDVMDSYTCPIYAYCAGFYGGNPEVAMVVDENLVEQYNTEHGTTLKALPKDCYILDASVRKMEKKKATFFVDFDVAAVSALSGEMDYSDLSDYVIPLKLVSKDESIKVSDRPGLSSVFLSPDMQRMGFIFKEAGKQVLNYSDATVIGNKLITTYTVYTPVENEWDNPVSFKLNGKTLGLEYQQLPEGSYTVSASAEGFSNGVSEIQYTVSIDMDKLPEIFYSVIAEVESGGKFIVMGENKSNTTLFTSILFDQKKLHIYDCNSWQSDVYAPAMILDGDAATFWHCAYNKNMNGVYGAVDLEIVIKADDPQKFNTVSILRRSGGYASDMRSGYVMVAPDDGNGAPAEFVKVGEFDWPKAQYPNPGPYLISCSATEQPASFIKLVITDTNRYASSVNHLANIAELNLYYR